jgi:heme A synthase
MACRGFPLCNGQFVPAANMPAHVQWTHRLLAYLLALHVSAAAVLGARRRATPPVAKAALLAFALVVAQVAVAAALVILPLPQSLQVAHLAVGAALWFAIVRWDALARAARSPHG